MTTPAQPAAPSFTVPVAGGDLLVHDLSGPDAGTAEPGAPLVVLVHGITANGLSWLQTAATLAGHADTSGCRIWAPDLRGRAGSRDAGEPYGLSAHVDDLVAIADAADAERFVFVGHSMGAFIGALASVTIPARLSGVVLIDGGPAFPPPPDLDIDAALAAVIGPAMTRLSMRFADDEAYLKFWGQHPAVAPLLAGPHAPAVTAYLLHDLVDDGQGQKMSSCVVDAIRADGRDVLADEITHSGVRTASEAGLRTEFIWAQRGLLNEEQGLYDEQRVAALQLPREVAVTAVRDINHYSVIFEQAGTVAIRDAVARTLRG